MNAVPRVRREVFLAPHVDSILTRLSRGQGAKSKSATVADALLTLNALLAGTMDPASLANNIRIQYGVETKNEPAR